MDRRRDDPSNHTFSDADPAPAPRVAVIGGGPAGLMAAEAAVACGVAVDLYEAKGSVGRKLLIAGRGGLNLTHSEPSGAFVQRYGSHAREVAAWLADFDAGALRAWARALGVDTFVGSSGRVFPSDMKAAPLLRAWVHRLRESGVRFHVRHRWLGWNQRKALRFELAQRGEGLAAAVRTVDVEADAVVLALGGASWPQLGSDGAWVPWLAAHGVGLTPLAASNCGFEVDWSAHFAARNAGQPIKAVVARVHRREGGTIEQQGELVVTEHGLEGQLIYALSAPLRDAIAHDGTATLTFDLMPGWAHERLVRELATARGTRTRSEHWRRRLKLEGAKAALVIEHFHRCAHAVSARETARGEAASQAEARQAGAHAALDDAERVARVLKALPIALLRPRPIAEAISSAGGVRFASLTDSLALRARPDTFVAGEMIEWDAPTGGYLLTACWASGLRAGRAAAAFADAARPTPAARGTVPSIRAPRAAG